MKHLAIVLLLVAVLVCPVSAQQNQQPPDGRTDEVYHYPIRPGMPAWAELRDADARVAATQVPEDVLSRMSTKSLARTCLDYPLLLHITAYNSYQIGIDNLFKFSNAHRELLQRADAGVGLLDAYIALESMNPDASALRRGELQFKYLAAELLLGQPDVLGTMSKVDKERLLDAALAKYNYKQSQLSEFGPMGLESSAFLLGKICVDADHAAFTAPQDEDVRALLATGMAHNVEAVDKVVSQAVRHQQEIKRGVE